jgi:hypothetical protein
MERDFHMSLRAWIGNFLTVDFGFYTYLMMKMGYRKKSILFVVHHRSLRAWMDLSGSLLH